MAAGKPLFLCLKMALWELVHNAGLTLGDRLQGKMNPLGSPYNDKKSEKNSGWGNVTNFV